jgi:hypothetical protein
MKYEHGPTTIEKLFAAAITKLMMDAGLTDFDFKVLDLTELIETKEANNEATQSHVQLNPDGAHFRLVTREVLAATREQIVSANN